MSFRKPYAALLILLFVFPFLSQKSTLKSEPTLFLSFECPSCKKLVLSNQLPTLYEKFPDLKVEFIIDREEQPISSFFSKMKTPQERLSLLVFLFQNYPRIQLRDWKQDYFAENWIMKMLEDSTKHNSSSYYTVEMVPSLVINNRVYHYQEIEALCSEL